jgi:3-phosphoshikimate 1-carboxyvinyltransferase
MGCTLSRPAPSTLRCRGKLKAGAYTIDGGVSSQYISGLLFAQALLGDSTLEITGVLESKPYVDMTREALQLFDAPKFHTPGYLVVEGDWSNGAFWLAANVLGGNIALRGLNAGSVQGDRAVVEILHTMETKMPTISAKDIPDLVPILAVCAAAKHGAVFTHIRRLRLKESDRVATTVALIEALGGKAEATEDRLTVFGTGLVGGTVDACNDHRIAMSAAIAAMVCSQPVRLLGAEAVNKSYPTFWNEYARLGGKYELYLR